MRGSGTGDSVTLGAEWLAFGQGTTALACQGPTLGEYTARRCRADAPFDDREDLPLEDLHGHHPLSQAQARGPVS